MCPDLVKKPHCFRHRCYCQSRPAAAVQKIADPG
jgi:hypothetical protein